MTLIRVPRLFYEDHAARDLPTPRALRKTKQNVWISPLSPHCAELLNDARYYATMDGFDEDIKRTICRSAYWTRNALLAAGITDDPEAMEKSRAVAEIEAELQNLANTIS